MPSGAAQQPEPNLRVLQVGDAIEQPLGGFHSANGVGSAESIIANGGAPRAQSCAFFFRPTPCGFRQVVQHLSKHVAYEINYLIHAGADAVVAAKVNWKRTDT